MCCSLFCSHCGRSRADIITFTVNTSGPSGIFYYDASVPNYGINPITEWYQVASD